MSLTHRPAAGQEKDRMHNVPIFEDDLHAKNQEVAGVDPAVHHDHSTGLTFANMLKGSAQPVLTPFEKKASLINA